MTIPLMSRVEEAADKHEAGVFKDNPDGFTCAPYCNGGFLSSAFSAGAQFLLTELSRAEEGCGPRLRFYENNDDGSDYEFLVNHENQWDKILGEYVPLSELLAAKAELAILRAGKGE